MTNYFIEPARLADIPSIAVLLRQVAANGGGLVRTPGELSDDYVRQLTKRSLQSGVTLVARAAEGSHVLGVILAPALAPAALAHILGELTMAVHPEAQGIGMGRALMKGLIDSVIQQHPKILRVELLTRESNERARALYRACGFCEEGRFEGRIHHAGSFEADIPMAWTRPR